jgi:hypothetical protein
MTKRAHHRSADKTLCLSVMQLELGKRLPSMFEVFDLRDPHQLASHAPASFLSHIVGRKKLRFVCSTQCHIDRWLLAFRRRRTAATGLYADFDR